ncbi:hypothetical protein [Roseiconus lacunae]|uniref:hypothetical protein n=1 Tax=Roseiconus lacunae TaxID=2605694 RepID=UPI001E6441DC|nr:hypothetical protein [Roseiconus lacunae]MCD0458160.1 hypothetical protein [Roseiconus lacunae]
MVDDAQSEFARRFASAIGLSQFLGDRSGQLKFLLILFIATASIRSIYTMPIEFGGDALKKWMYVQQFDGSGEALLTDHHTMRWSVTMTGVLVRLAFGDEPATYYVAPLIVFALAFTVLIRIARTAMPPWMLLPFGLILFIEPMMFRASSQFQPIVYGFCYVTLSYAFLSRWLETSRFFFFLLSVLFFFFAYGAKIPYGYFLPGLLLFLWRERGGRMVGIYSSIFAIFVAIEVVVFNAASDKFLLLGRASKLVETHTPGGGAWRFSYFDYILMWRELPVFDIALVALALGFSLYCLSVPASREIPKAVVAFSLMSFGYIVINMTLIVDFDTMLTPQGPMVKYLAVSMPFFCFIACGWIAIAIESAGPKPWQTKAKFAVYLATSVLAIQFVSSGTKPTYTYSRLTYPAPKMFCYRVNGHYQKLANWLKSGNVIYTKRLACARAFCILLRPYLDETQLVYEKVDESTFSIGLGNNSPDSKCAATWYGFSQFNAVGKYKKLQNVPSLSAAAVPLCDPKCFNY